MTTIAINPMVVSVSPSADATITRIQPTMHGGGGGIKKVIAVVAAVAIPIAAPTIAASIGLSGAIGAAIGTSAAAGVAGATIGSAIVGAGLGAISAKVTGQDVRRGAIMGGLSGGIAGYFRGAPQTQTTSSGALSEGQSSLTGMEGGTSATGTSQLGSQASGNIGPGDPTTFNAETLAEATAGGDQSLIQASYSTQGQNLGAQLSNTTNPNLVQTNLGGAQNLAQGGANLQGAVAGSQTAPTALSQLGPNASFGEKFVATMKDSGSALASKFTDPEALANVTMQAGGQLLGTVLAPDPEMPPEQREMLEMRKQELAELKERDEAAFNAQMDAAKQYLQQAKQYDPTYMAFQAANKEAIDQQRKLREQYRRAALGRGRDISEAEKRRMSLDSARQVSSEYDRGFQQGLSAQNKVTQAGLSAIPNSAQFANYTNALRNLQSDEGRLAEYYAGKSSNAAKNISDLFSNFNTETGTGVQYQRRGGQAPKAPTKKKSGLPDSGIEKKGGLITPEDMEEFYKPDQQYMV
tara:strand:+ start:4805 stop:6373 length:1569 start_codon:yes stop_codon:yes gene_type:complete